MFCVIYLFKVKSRHENEFKKAWKELTALIYEYEGSLGSRLHRQSEFQFIAYAQWPDRSTWENSGNRLPESSKEIRKIMKDSCERIEILHELEVEEDLLIHR